MGLPLGNGASLRAQSTASRASTLTECTFIDMSEMLPLFPLSTVLFPGMRLPLHIFEERYQTLVADLLAGPEPRRFGVIAIRAGREVGADSVAALHEVGCVAVVRQAAPTADGRYDLLTVGTDRFRLVDVDRSRPYLRGEIELLPDDPATEPGAAEAAAQLAQIPYASMAIITLAFRAGDFPAQQRSGYLVPAVDGRAVKAVTFSTIKWPHLAQAADPKNPVHIIRCSVGRSGDVAVLQRDDDDLAALAAAELAESIGITAQPVAHRVTRWGGGLPQYNVGHLDRVARVRQAVSERPGLAVAGAAYDGVGIPACVATARRAADQVINHLRATSPDGAEQRTVRPH